LKYAKLQATQQGCTLIDIIENSLREFFSRHSLECNSVKLETAAGAGLKPGVNLDDGRSLTDIMDGR